LLLEHADIRGKEAKVPRVLSAPRRFMRAPPFEYSLYTITSFDRPDLIEVLPGASADSYFNDFPHVS
jgi:hypothetical protein